MNLILRAFAIPVCDFNPTFAFQPQIIPLHLPYFSKINSTLSLTYLYQTLSIPFSSIHAKQNIQIITAFISQNSYQLSSFDCLFFAKVGVIAATIIVVVVVVVDVVVAVVVVVVILLQSLINLIQPSCYSISTTMMTSHQLHKTEQLLDYDEDYLKCFC